MSGEPNASYMPIYDLILFTKSIADGSVRDLGLGKVIGELR